jgi:predicted polyphosphate/ATP-dependent NAD kinase
VLKQAGSKNILVVATSEKINSLLGRPFHVDTGDKSIDQMLRGYIHVISGYKERIVYRITH